MYDRFDDVVQFVFATSEGPFAVAPRNVEIQCVIANRVPGQALFQKSVFVNRQNKEEVANPFIHSTMS